MSDDLVRGDPARLVGPHFYESHGDNAIPVAAVLIVLAIDPDEENTVSTYVLGDGVSPLVTHHGMCSFAERLFSRRLEDAIDDMTADE